MIMGHGAAKAQPKLGVAILFGKRRQFASYCNAASLSGGTCPDILQFWSAIGIYAVRFGAVANKYGHTPKI